VDEKGVKQKEILHLWKRDPVGCIRELIGNPAFRDHMQFAPQKAYEDCEGKNRMFDEMWSGDWWWNLQVKRASRRSESIYSKMKSTGNS